jgi:hypothetical protein
MLMPPVLETLFQKEREREIEASLIARIAARARDCCRQSRFARFLSPIRGRRSCARGAC